MIELYYWPTPNGKKITIMLEECELAYEVHPVNILKGEQFNEAFLAISPNNRMPAIVDRDGPGGSRYPLFESGAILIYLADKAGQFLPQDPAARYRVIEWLMFQMAGVGPMSGQAGHFMGYAPEKIPYAIERYRNETLRLYGVMDRRLDGRDYLAGDYSIADMAVFPWIQVRWLYEIELDEFPNLKRWYETLKSRPAVQRGMAVMKDEEKIGNPTEEAREALFGKRQFER